MPASQPQIDELQTPTPKNGVRGEDYLDAILAELKQGRRQWKRGEKLLEAFGYMRRRQTAVDLINSRLEAKGMYTVPTLTTEMPLDRAIRFRLKGAETEDEPEHEPIVQGVPSEVVEVAGEEPSGEDAAETVTIPEEPPAPNLDDSGEMRLIVGNLACAERMPVCINPNKLLQEALTIMDLQDFSQLVVASSPRDVKGIISFKSVARSFFLHGDPKTVADCLDVSVPRVELTEPVLRVLDRFNEHDVVLVMAQDKSLSGIVTPADIADEFRTLAGPFLLIGDIEAGLRWLVMKQEIDIASALAASSVKMDSSNPPAASDLTMGELHRILEQPDNWTTVGIAYDRATFCKELNTVREIRNAVMHFKDLPGDALHQLRRFANVVRIASTLAPRCSGDAGTPPM